MAAYATQQREPSTRGHSSSSNSNRLDLALKQAISGATSSRTGGPENTVLAESSFLDQLLDHIANRVAAVITERLVVSDNRPDEWFDSRHAAEYLGVHRDTLRKLAAESDSLRAGRSRVQALLPALRPRRVEKWWRTASPPRISTGGGGVTDGHRR